MDGGFRGTYIGERERREMRGNSRGCSRMRKRMSEVRVGERERERGGFLCGLNRDEPECLNVRETTNPHLLFPRACAYAGKRGIVVASEEYEGNRG